VLAGTTVRRQNVYIADIDAGAVNDAAARFGFKPVVVERSKPLPYADKYFDIVYCSSVIEHVTVPEEESWAIRSGALFKRLARVRQQAFAREIDRLGKQYFVQTPNVHFPIESHSWLPFAAYLPRWLLIPLLKVSNRVWIKHTDPDWCLLNRREFARLFPTAAIVSEKCAGFTKSFMAISTTRARANASEHREEQSG
jgi:hypothetical protein